jgi:hypothetical protein
VTSTTGPDLRTPRDGSALAHLPGALRVIGSVFVVAALANAVFFWSFLMWWPAGPKTLWQSVLAVVGVLAWAPQAPIYAAFDLLEQVRRFDAIEAHLTITLLTTATYAPLVMWHRERARRRRTTRCS